MPISVNKRAWTLFEALLADADTLGLAVAAGPEGEVLVDAAPAGIEAGLRIAEICLGGLGRVAFGTDAALPRWPATVTVASSQPVIACLGSQYAGWSLAHGEKPNAYFALGSGPARALARKEKLFAELGYADQAEEAVLVLEAAKPPPPPLLADIARACGVAGRRLGVIYAPTQSLVGSAQVVARVLEVALHKAHALHFPLAHIRDGIGAAPLPPPHPDFVTAMGRTNDAIIFGGRVHLFVSGPAEAARTLAERLPAATSRDYGRPFAETFRAAKGDFYAIDPMLFSPALALVTAIDSGETFRGGALDPALLDASFGAG
ncbi:methenyltetrahydromethanopterin cyclohydrolase [Acidisphaera rubrifaciens]|uniref:Methenyltetrahydromethanopterin cyclohydrolase n=1 Tax=Acidisphaera rubrifaciens HS-AP3 TaxID=1231350 RepID=A0A0D6P6A0_9PROT|nr:methenyltetrahydromethanopterin cyclohydrolase [Acidisphaera rubrifaciens]GAN76723.1 N5-,N10-methenyltetrahydromethanopterin cyclohydrolase [Acidisphaera rubrifaciens HS-AP3]